MKKIRNVIASGLVYVICTATILSGTQIPVAAATTSTAATSTAADTKSTASTAKKSTAKKKGWVKSGKKSYYYKSGKKVTGLNKISGKYYYFNSKGVLQKAKTKVKNITYYINPKGVVYVYKKGSKWYTAAGKKTTSAKALKQTTLISAEKIVEQVTTSKMNAGQKKKACFDWVIRHYYSTRRIFQNQTSWPEIYANDYFESNRGGNCFSDACSFAYLAKALGYKNVYVCVDTRRTGSSGHCWAEVNGLVYDPLFAEAKNYSKYFGCTYRTYGLDALRRVKI